MKKLKLLLLPVIAVLFFATECEDLLNEIGIVLSSDTYTYPFTVEARDAGSDTFISEETEANLDSLIEAKDHDPDAIEEITLKEATLSITNGENFNAFGSFELILAAEGLSEIVIATLSDIPDDSSVAEFELTDEDLVDYLQSDVFVVTIKGTLDEAITDPINITATIVYNIKVGV